MTDPTRLPLEKIITPASVAEAAEAVCTACSERKAIYPLGGGTWRSLGLPANRPGIGLSLENINRLIEYSPDDMTITVEAGATVAALKTILAERRQRLPVDVPSPEKTTLGQWAAVNFAGPCRYAYGTLKDYLLGCTAIDGQGMIFSSGGRVVKNATGYNLPRALIGSFGTLAIFTQMTLLVRPMPEKSALVACDLADFDTAQNLVADAQRYAIQPAALELVSAPVCQNGCACGPTGEKNVMRLFVLCEGDAQDVDDLTAALRSSWTNAGASNIMHLADEPAVALAEQFTTFDADVEIRVLPSRLIGLLQTLSEESLGIVAQCHAGDGIAQLRFSNVADAEFLEFLRETLRPLVERFSGKMILHRALADESLTHADVWGVSGDGFSIMRAIKERFDPNNILNPGRYIFPDA